MMIAQAKNTTCCHRLSQLLLDTSQNQEEVLKSDMPICKSAYVKNKMPIA